MKLEIPDRLTNAIRFLRGDEAGDRWLAQIPRRVAHFSAKWKIEPLEIATGGAMSCCVYAATPDGLQVVLKIPVDAAAGRREATALRRWATSGASPHVIAQSPGSGVYLMERVMPGTTPAVSGSRDESERYSELLLRMQSDTLPALRRPAPSICSIAETRLAWAEERFSDPEYEDLRALLTAARRVLGDLAQDDNSSRVLHADLQPKNVLQGDSGYVAIDPLLARGDINAEAALWAVVQAEGSSISERLDELGVCGLLERGRLESWAFFFAVVEYRAYMRGVAPRTRDFLGLAPASPA